MTQLKLPDGSVWTIDREGDIQHTLRYGAPTRGQLLAAAQMLSCYEHLLSHPAGANYAVKKLRWLRHAARASRVLAVDRLTYTVDHDYWAGLE